jgi:hypothetical protein
MLFFVFLLKPGSLNLDTEKKHIAVFIILGRNLAYFGMSYVSSKVLILGRHIQLYETWPRNADKLFG